MSQGWASAAFPLSGRAVLLYRFPDVVSSPLLQGNKPWISLPRGKGIRLTIAEERDKRLAAKQSSG